MKARIGLAIGVAVLTPWMTGCGDNADSVRKANAIADAIPAGIYSSVVADDRATERRGYEIHLPQGSASRTAEFARCRRVCFARAVMPRRGLNGIFFETPNDRGELVVAAVDRTGDTVTLNVDWGEGLETVRLRAISREFGLAAARGTAPDRLK